MFMQLLDRRIDEQTGGEERFFCYCNRYSKMVPMAPEHGEHEHVFHVGRDLATTPAEVAPSDHQAAAERNPDGRGASMSSLCHNSSITSAQMRLASPSAPRSCRSSRPRMA